jgi:hypothetical protein
MVIEALDLEGRLSVSIDMGEDLNEGASSSLRLDMSTARKYATDYFFLQLLLLLLPLLLPLLPLLLAAGIARPGRRRMKPKPPCAPSRSRPRVRNPTATRDMAI